MGKREHSWVISSSNFCRWNLTTIIIGTRKALIKGSQSSKFAKAAYTLAKKLGGLMTPLLSVVSNIISLGAKGIGQLTNI